MAGLPFSGCDGGRLREAPIRNRNGLRARPEPAPDQGSSDRRNGQAGHRISRSRTSPAESDVLGRARCHRLRRSFGSGGVGQDRVSARELRTRRNPGLRLMARQAEPRLRPRILPDAESRTSVRETARARKRNASSESAERRTARASALTGSLRGNPKGFGLKGLRRMRGRDLSRLPPSKKPIAEGLLRRNRTRRDSGARQRCRAPLLSGACAYRALPVGPAPLRLVVPACHRALIPAHLCVVIPAKAGMTGLALASAVRVVWQAWINPDSPLPSPHFA